MKSSQNNSELNRATQSKGHIKGLAFPFEHGSGRGRKREGEREKERRREGEGEREAIFQVLLAKAEALIYECF